MTGSTVSLEPLSSPSPSPPPPDELPFVEGPKAALDSGSELSELTEEEQDEGRGDSKTEVRTTSRPRESKRKRGNLLPPPMWGWAYKNSKKTEKGDWRTRLVEEEEEEEQPGPAKAMEEEEDDEQDHEVDMDRPVPQETESDGEDEREDDDEDLPARASDTEALDPVKDDPAPNDDLSDEDDLEEEAEAYGDVAVSGSNSHSRAPSQKGGAPPELSDDENVDEDDVVEEAIEDDGPVVESDLDDDPNAPVALEPETAGDAAPPVLEDNSALMDVDPIIPSPPLVTPTPHAAASSSIMAGSMVVAPPSRSASTASSTSGSPSTSRSPTPEPDGDVPSEQEPEPEPEHKVGHASRKRKPRTKRRKSKADVAAEQDADADQPRTLDVDDGDAADMEEADLDSPEMEMELESDLQPAHRAEALDVLATIELKFALLRERLYVEKMETLAWEEALVAEGTHPELLHLNEELSNRRDKRLELASRRRDLEVSNVMKRRKLDEDGVWSWWKAERDDLQTEMISETNRKRRKLERERRALERPQPERHMPGPPQDIREPPSLREIVKSYPFGVASSGKPSRKSRATPGPLAYPQLSTLPHSEIVRDLEFLFQHRRGTGGFDAHRQLINPALGGPVPQHFDYPMSMATVNGPGVGTRLGPGPSGFQHPHYPETHSMGMPNFPAPTPRPQHHPSSIPGSLPNLHPSQAIDQDMAPGHRPGSGPGHLGPPHIQHFGGMPPVGGPSSLMRPRSISPVPVQSIPNRMIESPAPPGFLQTKSNGWTGGPSMLGPGGKEPKRPSSVADGRDTEKERERLADSQKMRERLERDRDIEREREERVYPMPMRHAGHQHSHSHVHAPPGQPPHIHVVQHHHRIGPHHHHVVHHHHPQLINGSGGSGQGQPMSALSSGVGAGPTSIASPRPPREAEPRHIHPSSSTENVEMAAGQSRHILPSAHMSVDGPRDRGRPIGPAPVGPHERLMTPFVMAMAPSSGMQPGYPGSPRNGLPPPTAPSSVGPSRRGSFSAPDENGLPRPASSASASRPSQNQGSSNVHRHSISRRPQTPPAQPRPSPWSSPPHARQMEYGAPRSPPHANQASPSHMSPSNAFPGPMRSPTRVPQPPLGMQLPPPPSLSVTARSPPVGSESVTKNGSPGLKQPFGRPSSPGLLKAHPGAPRPSGISNHEPIGMGGLRSSASGPIFPPSHSNSSQPHPPRIPNGSIPDIHSNGGPVAAKIVPVDRS